jgi:hypothetical protein
MGRLPFYTLLSLPEIFAIQFKFYLKFLNFVFEVVSSCWRNSVSKMVIKSAAARTRRKAVRTLEELYFSRVPRLQAHPDELDKQEFLRASSVVSPKLRPDEVY